MKTQFSPTAGEDFTVLQRILRLRQTGIPDAAAISSQQAPWLYQPTSTISSEFLARQRFKLVADRLLATSTSTDEATRLQAALDTYQVLTKDNPKLVGVADVSRWARSERILLGTANASPQVSYNANRATRVPPGTLAVALQGESGPAYIRMDAQTKIAADLVITVGVRDSVALKKMIILRNGKISVPSNVQVENRDVIERLRQHHNLPLELRPTQIV